MRVGVDGRKFPEIQTTGPIVGMQRAKALGLDGVFFRTVLEMSPSLDPGELREIRAEALHLDLYLETGLGKVNPLVTAESPELRDIGDGDILLGFEKMIAACAEIGCSELWIGTANKKPQYHGRFGYDRFRTDVDWQDQLQLTIKFLSRLAPIANHYGINLNLENHEELTSHEVVRVVETVGAETMGVVFDTSNMLQRGEDPLAACCRLLPFIRQTHCKDAELRLAPEGIYYAVVSCGHGIIDFESLLKLLAKERPQVNLTIENRPPDPPRAGEPQPTSETLLEVFDPVWRASDVDLTDDELTRVIRLAARAEDDAPCQTNGPAAPPGTPFGVEESIAFITESASHLRTILGTIAAPSATTEAGGPHG